MRRLLQMLALPVLGLLVGAAAPDACPVPDELALHGLALPAAAEALARGKPLRIIAFGSGSTLGQAAGDPTRTYPARLQARLAARLPKAAIEVVDAGVPRQDAAQMLERLDHDVIERHPALVVWEVGTNDATREREPDDFANDLEDGIARLQAAHIDVILMDMQYAPSTATIINFDPYLDALHQAADIDEVPVFRRYDIMRTWSEQGVFRFDSVAPAERLATARAVYDCEAALLAQAIAEAVQ